MERTAHTSNLLRFTTVIALGWAAVSITAMASPTSAGDAVLVRVIADGLVDSDGDGLPDVVEIALGTDPHNPDTSGDSIPDGWKVWYGLDPLNPDDAYEDANGDGLTNLEKYEYGLDPYSFDSDNDLFWDYIEIARGTDAASPSSYPKSGVPHDVNHDGIVNAADVQLVINGLLGKPVPVPVNVSGVGDVSAIDVQLVIISALGMDS